MDPFDDRGLIHVHLTFILGKWLTQNNTFAFNFMRCEYMKRKLSWMKLLWRHKTLYVVENRCSKKFKHGLFVSYILLLICANKFAIYLEIYLKELSLTFALYYELPQH